MPARWSFFAFDWGRYLDLKPKLRTAAETGDFVRLGIPEANSLLAGFHPESTPEEVANALVTELCGTGEALFFEGGIPELIHRLRRQPNGEEVTEILGSLVSGEPNVEDWFRLEHGLVGILTPEMTQKLERELAALTKGMAPLKRPKGLGSFTRRFTTTEAATDRFEDLTKLIADCASRELGLGVLREG